MAPREWGEAKSWFASCARTASSQGEAQPAPDTKTLTILARLSGLGRVYRHRHRRLQPWEIPFGAMQANLDLSYDPSMVFFTWARFNEMDAITGDSSAKLLEDGAIEILVTCHNADEATLKAKREPSSTAC